MSQMSVSSLACATFFRLINTLVRTRALRCELVERGGARDDAHRQREHLVSVVMVSMAMVSMATVSGASARSQPS